MRNKNINENRTFISIDEISFGRNSIVTRGYSKKGKKLFIRQFILGTDSAQIPNSYITQFYNNHTILKNKLDSIPRYNGDRNIYSSGLLSFVLILEIIILQIFKNG